MARWTPPLCEQPRAFWARPTHDPGSPVRTRRDSESGARGVWAPARRRATGVAGSLGAQRRNTGIGCRFRGTFRRRVGERPDRGSPLSGFPARSSGLRWRCWGRPNRCLRGQFDSGVEGINDPADRGIESGVAEDERQDLAVASLVNGPLLVSGSRERTGCRRGP